MAEQSPRTTYFGLWSKRKLDEVKVLLDQLGARYEVVREEGLPQDRLENWCAWDYLAEDPHTGFHLDIWSDDLSKVGYKIVEKFPERRFDDSPPATS